MLTAIPVTMVEQSTTRVHLIFHSQADSTALGMDLGLVSIAELLALENEVSMYNEHARNLIQGLVPKWCYANPEDADLFLRASRQKGALYTRAGFPTVGERAYYEGREYKRYFQIVCQGPLPANFIDYSNVESSNDLEPAAWKYEAMSWEELTALLEDPLPMDDVYSMGYRVLPMTKRLMLRQGAPIAI